MNEYNFDLYLKRMSDFQGKMNMMANSIELLLNVIVERLKLEPKLSIREKLKLLRCNLSKLPELNELNYQKLFSDIIAFNKIWNISKHGMVVGGSEILTLNKNNTFHQFTNERINEINNNFSYIIKRLTLINNTLVNV